MKEIVSRNAKGMKKLSSKVKRSQKGSVDVESIANIECNNRFAVLGNINESNAGRTNGCENCDLALSKGKRQKSTKTRKAQGRQSKPKSVKTIDAPMGRDQGKLLNDPQQSMLLSSPRVHSWENSGTLAGHGLTERRCSCAVWWNQ